MRVAFFGGSFDPPHVGHVLSVLYAMSAGGFERALVVPVHEHAFDKPLHPYEHRVEMCRLAMSGLVDVEVSTLEQELPKPSYTLRTLLEIRRQHPDWELSLVAGTDVLADSDKWHRFDEVRALAPPFPLERAGVGHDHEEKVLLPDVSSTVVRQLLARRDDPRARAELERVLPAKVRKYVDRHGLYR